MHQIFKIILSCRFRKIPQSVFGKYRGMYLALINVLKLSSSYITRPHSIAKSGNTRYSYSSKIPVSNSKQAFMERPYLFSISPLKEVLDLCLPQLNILAGLLRKLYCQMREKTSVIHISVNKQLLIFVCTKGNIRQSTFPKGCVFKSRYSTMLNRITGTNFTTEPVYSTFQDKLL